MALIPCPECEHQVSDRAVACPQCGRPVSTFADGKPEPPPPKRRAAAARAARVEGGASLPSIEPSAVAREKQLQVSGDGVALECVECGEDVTHDIFRTRTEKGFRCGDCEEEEHNRTFQARQRLQRWTRAIFLAFVIGTILFGVVSLTLTSNSPKATTIIRKR